MSNQQAGLLVPGAPGAVAVAKTPVDIDMDGLKTRTDAVSPAGKYEPVSEGQHVGRFVDCVDLGVQEYQGKQSHRLMWVLMVNEVDVDGNYKLISEYCTTSLFSGGVGYNPSKHIVILRGVMGMPGLTAESLGNYSTGKLIGKLARLTVQHKLTGNGRLRGVVAAWARAQDGDTAPPLDAYQRPDFIQKQAAGGEKSAAEAQAQAQAQAFLEAGPQGAPAAQPAQQAAQPAPYDPSLGPEPQTEPPHDVPQAAVSQPARAKRQRPPGYAENMTAEQRAVAQATADANAAPGDDSAVEAAIAAGQQEVDQMAAEQQAGAPQQPPF